MEFIGPQPEYCAEHVHLDAESLYCKCQGTTIVKASGGSTQSRGRFPCKSYSLHPGCREVVLKEFGYCHKHYHIFTHFLVGPGGIEFAQNKLRRVNELIVLLEKEATQAKQIDGDMFQRKTKIIPKFKVGSYE